MGHTGEIKGNQREKSLESISFYVVYVFFLYYHR